jgi:hypothetical protein
VSFSFNETLVTTKDIVRAALGDTDEASALRSDEAILATLAMFDEASSPINATIGFLALSLANEYRRRVSSFSESGGISVSWADRVKGWDQLARDIHDRKVSFDPATIGGATWMAPVDLNLDILEPSLARW